MNIQNNDFICPHCLSHLCPAGKIVLSVKTREGMAGLLLLSPLLGEYTLEKHPALKLSHGEHLDFFCPVCHANLSAKDGHINLARILIANTNGTKSEVFFSKIVGEKCTFHIHGKEVEPYGPDAPEYLNYWGENSDY